MAKDCRLAPSQMKQVADAALDAGLDLGDFDWSYPTEQTSRVSYINTRLVHRPTGAWYFFHLSHNESTWWPHRPDEHQLSDQWAAHLRWVTAWLKVVRVEHDTPDLWAAAAQQRTFIVGEPSGPFTPGERAQIKKALPELGRHIVQSAAPATADDIARIEARIEYLIEAVDRLDRLDFKNAMLGTLLSLVVEFGLKSSTVAGIWGFASTHLATILGHLRALGQ